MHAPLIACAQWLVLGFSNEVEIGQKRAGLASL